MQKEVSAAVVKRKEVMGRVQENVEGFTEEEMKILQDQYKSAEEVSEDDMVKLMGETAGEKEPSETKPASE
jgi:small subunit ribosomal protein S2